MKAKAQLRLLELVEPAVAALAKELVNPDASPGERIKAAEAILDRTGHPRGVAISTSLVRDELLRRLIVLRDQALAERADEQDQQQIEGECL